MSAFWVACACAAAGGVVPLALTGTSGRLTAVVVPYWGAAILLAGCALLLAHGRTLVSAMYFVAGLAIVYGMLAMFALPLKLAGVGTCPVNGRCPAGLEAPLSSGEDSAIALTMAAGLLAIGVGFFGLVILYRRLGPQPSSVPTRRIPPVAPHPASSETPATPAPPAAAVPTAAVMPSAKAAVPEETAAEHEPSAELPAPEEPPELPPHESSSAEA